MSRVSCVCEPTGQSFLKSFNLFSTIPVKPGYNLTFLLPKVGPFFCKNGPFLHYFEFYIMLDAIWKVKPDFGLDNTAVDTALGDDYVQPFYTNKEMKHGGFDMMSELFFFLLYSN